MAQPLSEELKQQWKEIILKQRQTKLSIASWCRQNGITTHSFYYWQGRLFPKSPIGRASFTEVHNEKSIISNEIILEYQGGTIRLNEHFNPIILAKCLEVLRKC